jgi:DNA-binding IclR family transcriptional regulator
MEVSTMGRKVNSEQVKAVLETIQEHDGKFRANDVAKHLGLHPQMVARLLPAIGKQTEELLYEDDKGFLGIFKW